MVYIYPPSTNFTNFLRLTIATDEGGEKVKPKTYDTYPTNEDSSSQSSRGLTLGLPSQHIIVSRKVAHPVNSLP